MPADLVQQVQPRRQLHRRARWHRSALIGYFGPFVKGSALVGAQIVETLSL